MKVRPFMQYALEKVRETAQRENYLFDCLWAVASDMRFTHEKKPTMPRWSELTGKKSEEKKPVLTKEMVKERFRRLKG